MNTNGKNSNFYINMILAVSIAVILIVIVRPFFLSTDRGVSTGIKERAAPVVSTAVSESVYDIDKVKQSIPQSGGVNAGYSDLNEMYEKSDKTNVGGNMVEAWKRVRPEDKAKLSGGFDQQIVKAQEALKEDPEDKHARNLLYISEALKKMSSEGFNCKLKNKADDKL